MYSQPLLTTRRIGIVAAILAGCCCGSAFAQQSYKSPRTEQGYPDLQGIWTNATITPLQRPDQYGQRRAHTAAEAQALEHTIATANAAADKPTAQGATVQDLDKSCELR